MICHICDSCLTDGNVATTIGNTTFYTSPPLVDVVMCRTELNEGAGSPPAPSSRCDPFSPGLGRALRPVGAGPPGALGKRPRSSPGRRLRATELRRRPRGGAPARRPPVTLRLVGQDRHRALDSCRETAGILLPPGLVGVLSGPERVPEAHLDRVAPDGVATLRQDRANTAQVDGDDRHLAALRQVCSAAAELLAPAVRRPSALWEDDDAPPVPDQLGGEISAFSVHLVTFHRDRAERE